MAENKDNKVAVICSVVLGVIYFTAGVSKFFHWFPNIIGPVWLIEELAKHQLALFGYFIALSQIVIGALVLSHRFRLVGALMLLPMHLCITIVPLSLGWAGTPYINAVLLTFVLYVLYVDRFRLFGMLRLDDSTLTAMPFKKNMKNKSFIFTFILMWLIALSVKYYHLIM